jgi:hypothetical protein
MESVLRAEERHQSWKYKTYLTVLDYVLKECDDAIKRGHTSCLCSIPMVLHSTLHYQYDMRQIAELIVETLRKPQPSGIVYEPFIWQDYEYFGETPMIFVDFKHIPKKKAAVKVMRKLLTYCKNSIKTYVDSPQFQTLGVRKFTYVVPPFTYGLCEYDVFEAANYLVKKLTREGFFVYGGSLDNGLPTLTITWKLDK